jgi:hypothetical protein
MAHARFHVGFIQKATVSASSPTLPAVPVIPAWRLVGGNNRVLGCSPDPFVDFESAVAAVQHLRSRIEDAAPVLGVDPQSGARSWRLEIDGVVVARSGRGYLRGRENLYNLAHFMTSVPIAVVPTRAGWSVRSL